ncbi:MAG TPA: hypothetical protein VI895_14575 [Bdellovibrionota bacterium]|nr:hypothetical protein [Bdellovibrionota bacterium]
MNRRELSMFLVLIAVSAGAMFALSGCQNSSNFAWDLEGSGPPPPPPTTPGNPFVPNPNCTAPGNCTDGETVTDAFTQASVSSKVDIVWMVDSSGSMSNNQDALKANASTFTNRLVASNVDFKLMIITSDSGTDSMLKPRCGENGGSVITSSNAADFGACAVVGDNGSGRENGVESVRRALDASYPRGPWNSSATPAPLNPGFLRSDADLQVLFVSDEEDQEDGNPPGSNSWDNKAGVTADDITALRQEMAQDLEDGGRLFNNRYAYFPFVANHIAFLQGLKSGGKKVRAHAIVSTVISTDPADQALCTYLGSTEEIGQRYIAIANLLGGSVTDVCGNWASTMDKLGLQVSGLESCFALSKVPTDTASIAATVNGAAVDSSGFSYVPTGNQVCFDSVPDAGASISITYH